MFRVIEAEEEIELQSYELFLTARFHGNDFVSVNLRQRPAVFGIKEHTLKFDLKTTHPNGILLYTGSRSTVKDFLLLDLVHGKLRYGKEAFLLLWKR